MSACKMKKAGINVLLIGVILVAVATVGMLFYSILYGTQQDTEYTFPSQDYVGDRKVLVSGPDIEQPTELPTIEITGFIIGTGTGTNVVAKSQFKLGETVAVHSLVEKFKQNAVDGKYSYGMEQWIATQDENSFYINELTGMTANFSKYSDAPVESVELTNQLNSSYLSPGKYTVKVFVVDRLTQDIDLKEEVISIV